MFAVDDGEFTAENSWNPNDAGCLGEPDYPVEPVVIGEGQRLKSKLGSFFDKFLGAGGSVEETEM